MILLKIQLFVTNMHAEQYHKPMSTQDHVFENSKWKTYNDNKYLETTHFEGFPNSAREILIQSRDRLKEEAKANSVTASSSQGVMNSDSSAINYKPVHLINAESIDVPLDRASRMFHIPIEEMPKQRQKPRKCFVDFQGPPLS